MTLLTIDTEIASVTARKGTNTAVIDLVDEHGRTAHFYCADAAFARELLSAAFDALRILDPDYPVIIRASNKALYALDEILPPSPPPSAGELADAALEHDPDGVADAVIAAVAEGTEVAIARLAPEAPDDGPCCGARLTTADGPFFCTAVPGHDGDHVAYGLSHNVHHTWPQEAAAEAPPLVVRTCVKCKITSASVPMVLYPGGPRCHNVERCADRQAAQAGAR